MSRSIAVALFLTISTLGGQIANAIDIVCDQDLNVSLSIIPVIFIAPDQPAYSLIVLDQYGDPIEGCIVTLQIPACLTGTLVPDHPAGGWSGLSYVPSASYILSDTTNGSGVASFVWTQINAPSPSGGCIPDDLLGPSGSCGAIGCTAALISIRWEHDDIVECATVKRSIVSPDIVSGGRMCDDTPWEGDGSYGEVGLEDAVEFTGYIAGSIYDKCIDLNGDNSVNVSDAVKVTPYLASAASYLRSVAVDPFYGDSLNLPIGVGDSATVKSHAISLSLVQVAMDSAESRGYVRSEERDNVLCLARPDGMIVQSVLLAYDVPESLFSLPDSVTAVAAVEVTTVSFHDSLVTGVELALMFIDSRGDVPAISVPGDGSGGYGSAYVGAHRALVGLTTSSELTPKQKFTKCNRDVEDFATHQLSDCMDFANGTEDPVIRRIRQTHCSWQYRDTMRVGHRNCLYKYVLELISDWWN